MKYKAATVNEYVDQIDEERKKLFLELKDIIASRIPQGFEEQLSYGFPSWVVPLSLYPDGYHCRKNESLPFLSLAVQKNFIGFYHMGIYLMPDLFAWFETEYKALGIGNPDMGKSCLRLKKPEKIPFKLIAELCSKIGVDDWISCYEKNIKPHQKG